MYLFILSDTIGMKRCQGCQPHWCHEAHICIYVYIFIILFIYTSILSEAIGVKGVKGASVHWCHKAYIYIYSYIYVYIYIYIYIYTNILYSLSMGVSIVSETLDAQRRQRCQRHWCHKAYTYTYIYIYIYMYIYFLYSSVI